MSFAARNQHFPETLWRRLLPRDRSPWLGAQLDYATLTLPRLLNIHRLHKEYTAKAVKLRSKPVKLVIEATNVCNLNCPACFTGVGENGRVRSNISMDLYRKVMDELGDTLIEVEFYNWGEPFLCKSIFAMIEVASSKGLSTTISSNFSVPFDEAKAEALVRSGLTFLGVSIDGATQENYEKYRVGGNLDLVLRNAQMVIDAKKRLGSATPNVIWEYHVFPHNVDEVEMARARSEAMGFDIFGCDKGLTYGDEWDDTRYSYFMSTYSPIACAPLWHYAVVHNDGGVAVCCGAFYREDDLGRLSTGPGQPGAKTFAEIWNGEKFQAVRGLFASKLENVTPSCGGLCDECPQTKTYQNNLRHLADGNPAETFKSAYSTNDGHKYFYSRRPQRDTRKALKPERV